MLLCLVFIVLQNGVYIDDLSVPNLKIKKLYIKWNKKINITADEIKITTKKKTKKTTNYKEINNYFKEIVLFDTWFEKITINKIHINDITASFKYVDGKNGFLDVSSPDFSLKSSLGFESKLFNVRINEFHDYKRNIDLQGNIIFNAYDLELTSSLKTSINDEVFLDIFITANDKKLFYKISSDKYIKSITHTVDMFPLDKRVRYWIVDAIKMKNASLKSAYGWVDYKHLGEAYKNIYAKAVLHKLDYRYDMKLDAIHTKNTTVEFKDGVLNIMPHNAYTYGFFLDKSWLKIDFTKKQELLTLYLKFQGMLNQDILNLLDRYAIKLPVLQNTGTVDTNLTLSVNLRTIDVEAHGDFFTKKGNFKYLGLDIDAFDTHVRLDNFNVKIKDMLAKYEDIATAKVDVDFNAKEQKGTIGLRFKDITFKDLDIKLDNHKELDVNYHISPNNDIIDIDKSNWKFKNYNVKLDKQQVPFDLDTLTAQIPTTLVKVDDFASAYVSGTASLKPKSFDLNTNLLKFMYKNIKLSQSSADFKVTYKNKNMHVQSIENIRVNFDDFTPLIKNISLNMKNNTFYLLNADIDLENILTTSCDGYYSNRSNVGYIDLKNLDIKHKMIKNFITDKQNLSIAIDTNNKKVALKVKKLDMQYISADDSWKLEFNSIEKLIKQYKKLQEYDLKNGRFTIFKDKDNKDIMFKAETKYPYKILVKDNTPIEDYTITGKLQNKTKDISLKINDVIDLKIGKDIEIRASDIGVNLNAIMDYFSDQDKNTTNTDVKNVFMELKDSYLWISKDRHVISDKINLQYFNKITTAQLTYKKGKAGFKFDDGKFHLYGEDFNDYFMDNLFALSKFKDGDLSFSLHGTTKEYDGVFYINHTTIMDYKILNNILAFINTVPSLITFSLPGYNKNGLAVKKAYANFHLKNDVFNFKNIYLDSKEIDIVGRGNSSIKNNTIDLELNLKSDLGSSMKNIPIVGYILLGDDTISTSLKISGSLHDPKVRSMIAKDIIVAPVNIIKRTLLLPFSFSKEKKK